MNAFNDLEPPERFDIGEPKISRPTNFLSRSVGETNVFFSKKNLIGTIMSMITASLWVPRGAAASFPEKYDVDEDELARISKLAKLQLEDAKDDLTNAKNGFQSDNEAQHSGSDAEEGEVKMEQSQA